jgi:hypothetical protein
MGFSGKLAVDGLSLMAKRVALLKKDNTDKLWSYRIKNSKKTEFAFDPKTSGRGYFWFDREIPSLAGVTEIQGIAGENMSTALDRVFSGGIHKARFKAKIADVEAFYALVEHYESL